LITALFFVPLLAGALLEYGACRFPKRKFWRCLPPFVSLVVTIAVALFRYYGWSEGEERAPISTLLFVPGISALAVFLGIFLGWRLWKTLWTPRIVTNRKGRKP